MIRRHGVGVRVSAEAHVPQGGQGTRARPASTPGTVHGVRVQPGGHQRRRSEDGGGAPNPPGRSCLSEAPPPAAHSGRHPGYPWGL